MATKPPYRPLDLNFVDVSTAEAREFWAERLQCSVHQLLDAVAFVGNTASRIDEHLRANRKTT